jgi:thiol-disulfide isomerase/thioredoxin
MNSPSTPPRRRGTFLLAGLVVAVAAAGGFFWQWQAARAPVAEVPVTVSAAEPAAGTPAAPAARPVPATLPAITLKDRDDRPRSLSEWQGKALVVNFWATWCPPCVREIPLLNRVREARRTQGVEFVGIAVDFREDVLAFAAKQPIGYPLLIGEEDGLAAVDAVGMSPAFPFTLFTDRQHRIVTVKIGELHQEDLDLILDTIRALDDGQIGLEAAQSRINDGLKTLSTARARQEAADSGKSATNG